MSEEHRFEFARAVIATSRLAQLDLRAVDLFGNTPEAAWRAFRFLLYCLPIIMLISWPEAGEYVRRTGNSTITYCLIAALQVLISGLGFMLVVWHLGKRLGYNQHFAHYVCAQFSVALPVTMLIGLMIGTWRLAGVSAEGEQLLHVLVYAVQIVIDWAVTYATLRIRPLAAFGICVLGVLFSKVVQLFMALIIILSIPAMQSIQP